MTQVPPPQIYGVYAPAMLTTKLTLHITEVGQNLRHNLEAKLQAKIANKCIEEGYVSPNNIAIQQYSSGEVVADHVIFHVAFTCDIARPVEGMIVSCVAKAITKAGVNAHVVDNHGNVPVNVFVTRDHNIHDPLFARVKEGDTILCKVVGTRYELNDPYICVIATLYQDIPVAPRKVVIRRPKVNAMDAMYPTTA